MLLHVDNAFGVHERGRESSHVTAGHASRDNQLAFTAIAFCTERAEEVGYEKLRAFGRKDFIAS